MSELSQITTLDASDLMLILDVDDLEMGYQGTNKTVSISQLINPIFEVSHGSIQPNKALIADSNGKIEGVSAAQLSMLNISAGVWGNSKVLSTDSNGKLEGVSKEQFQRLNVTSGTWESGRLLSVDDDGALEGVLKTQFQALNVVAGVIDSNRVAVFDEDKEISSDTLRIAAGQTSLLQLMDSVNNVQISILADKVSIEKQIEGVTKNANLTFDGVEITAGNISSRYEFGLMEIGGLNSVLSATSGGFIIQDGLDECVVKANELSFTTTSGLTMILVGLPTQDPQIPNKVWVDSLGYLRVSQG